MPIVDIRVQKDDDEWYYYSEYFVRDASFYLLSHENWAPIGVQHLVSLIQSNNNGGRGVDWDGDKHKKEEGTEE